MAAQETAGVSDEAVAVTTEGTTGGQGGQGGASKRQGEGEASERSAAEYKRVKLDRQLEQLRDFLAKVMAGSSSSSNSNSISSSSSSSRWSSCATSTPR